MITRRSILVVVIVLAALSGWASWLHWGPARPPRGAGAGEPYPAIAPEIGDNVQITWNGSVEMVPQLEVPADKTLRIEGTLRSELTRWAEPLPREKLLAMTRPQMLEFMNQSSKNQPSTYIDFEARFLRWSFRGEHVDSIPHLDHRWIDDSTVTFGGSIAVPQRAGTYELRVVLRERRVGPSDPKNDPKHILARRLVKVSAPTGAESPSEAD